MQNIKQLLSVALAALAGTALMASEPLFAESREFYIQTVHIDGKTNTRGDTNHKPEPFPDTSMPRGGGLQLTEPNEYGEWRIRAFTFQPSQIVVNQGDDVRLHFIGVQGASHTIEVEGNGVDAEFTLKRGRMKTVEISSVQAGLIQIECYDHEPNMRAEIIVLP